MAESSSLIPLDSLLAFPWTSNNWCRHTLLEPPMTMTMHNAFSNTRVNDDTIAGLPHLVACFSH